MSAQEVSETPAPVVKLCGRCKMRPRRYNQKWCLECHAAYQRERPRSRYKDDPVKIKARNAVRLALARGDLVKGPCEQDGEECKGRIQGHHDDYGAPLVVRWLCRRHHRIVHGRVPGGAADT